MMYQASQSSPSLPSPLDNLSGKLSNVSNMWNPVPSSPLSQSLTSTVIPIPATGTSTGFVNPAPAPLNILEGQWSLCYEGPNGFRTCSALRQGAVVHCKDASLSQIVLDKTTGKYRMVCTDGFEQDVTAPSTGINFAMVGYEPPMMKSGTM